jgi:hypothetical protein
MALYPGKGGAQDIRARIETMEARAEVLSDAALVAIAEEAATRERDDPLLLIEALLNSGL